MQIQTYYTLVEKDTAKVNKLWKGIHIILLLSAAVSGFITCFSLGKITHGYGEHCVLYAEIAFESPTTARPPLLPTLVTKPIVPNITVYSAEVKVQNQIDLTNTEWGTYRMCSFCQFTPLMSMIFALCWLMFFIMCGPGGAGYQSDVLSKPWHVVYPALIFSTIFSITLSASTVHISNGLTEFCRDFKERVVFKVYRCIPEIDDFTAIFWDGKTKGVYIYSILCFIFAHFGLMAWWTQTALLVLRIFCIADFDLLALRKTTKSESPLLPIRTQEDLRDIKEMSTMIKPAYKHVIMSVPSTQDNCSYTDF